MKAIDELLDFLPCATPMAWIDAALKQQDILLIDHANCEKKAASTALMLMYRYVEYPQLLQKMSRLAREELRHFEKVLAIMQERGIEYRQINAARYAGELYQQVRHQEPYRLIDTLILGALIEARSCERFYVLAPYLDEELERFYTSLLYSEARHFQEYLTYAEKIAGGSVNSRINQLIEIEKNLILSEDPVFRFHSGVPQV